jgi:hypothetical protein
MKITVVVDNNGHVLGTYSQPAQVPEGYPTFQIHGGQTIPFTNWICLWNTRT